MSLELTDLIGPGVAVVAVAVGVWQYRLTSLREFIKPVREAQLKLYQEASSAAAQIATLQQESPEWIKARQEFLRLYYGPLAIVESFDHATESGERLTVERHDHFQIMPRRREAVQRAWCEPVRPEPCACAFLQGVARTLVGIQGQAVGGRLSGGCTGLSKATVDEEIEPENRKVGAPAGRRSEQAKKKIGQEHLQL
jgi:hypothetical protein